MKEKTQNYILLKSKVIFQNILYWKLKLLGYQKLLTVNWVGTVNFYKKKTQNYILLKKNIFFRNILYWKLKLLYRHKLLTGIWVETVIFHKKYQLLGIILHRKKPQLYFMKIWKICVALNLASTVLEK